MFIYLVFFILISLTYFDLKYKAVPDYLLILLLMISFFTKQFNFVVALEFAGSITLLELFVTFYIQNIKSKIVNDETLKDKKSLGEGDIPVVAVIGGILGVQLGVLAIFLSAIFAIIPSVLNMILKQDEELPFIPFLTLGFVIVFLYQNYFLNLIQIILMD